MQVVLFYLQAFRRNLLLKCVPQPKNLRKKSLIMGFKVVPSHRC